MDTASILVKRVKPDFKKLGPRYGKLMKQINETLAGFTQEDISSLEKEWKMNLLTYKEKSWDRPMGCRDNLRRYSGLAGSKYGKPDRCAGY